MNDQTTEQGNTGTPKTPGDMNVDGFRIVQKPSWATNLMEFNDRGNVAKIGLQKMKDLMSDLTTKRASAKDYLSPTTLIKAVPTMVTSNGAMKETWGLNLGPDTTVILSPWAKSQVWGRMGIPMKYGQKMEAFGMNDLISANVNRWMSLDPQAKYLVRTWMNPMTEKVEGRAFLSPSYRVMDNIDVALVTFDEVQKAGALFQKADFSDTKMYLTVVHPDREYTMDGHPVFPGAMISGSDVGDGAVRVEPFLWSWICQNLCIHNLTSIRKIHLGPEMEVAGVYSPETLALESQAVFGKIRDLVKSTLNDSVLFDDFFQKMKNTKSVVIPDTVQVIDGLSHTIGLTQTERDGLLNTLMTDRNIPSDDRGTAFGLVNAMTAFSQTVTDVDRAMFLNRIAGGLVATPKDDILALAEVKKPKKVVIGGM